MKILFISDIHGITTNLEYIKKTFEKQNCNLLVVLGDLYRSYVKHPDIDPLGVKDFLESFQDKLICMQGNNDTVNDQMKSNFPILSDLSLIYIDNIPIYLTHGHRYNMRDHKKLKSGVLIYGHEHIPYIVQDENMTYINTGSISTPRNHEFPTYAIYENNTFTIYNIKDEIIDSIIIKK